MLGQQEREIKLLKKKQGQPQIEEPAESIRFSARSVKAVIEKAKSHEARCTQMAANGQSCVAYVQKYYMQCRAAKP